MHQQVRLATRKARREGAKPDDGSLVDILTILKGTNLRSAGGADLARGGEFVFSVHHDEGDDTADEKARDLLNGEGYEAGVFTVDYCLVDDREGALLECIQKIEAQRSEPVIEVHVLTAEDDGKIPVQVVTQSMLGRERSS